MDIGSLTPEGRLASVAAMGLRGMHVLLFGACCEAGQRATEALLALGAEVVAADLLRTRLEQLRADLGQHERLHVAECDANAVDAARALLADVSRDRPLSALVVASGAEAGPPPALLEGLRHMQPHGGRALWIASGLHSEHALQRFEPHGSGVEVRGIALDPEAPWPGHALARCVVEALDPDCPLPPGFALPCPPPRAP